MTAVEQCLACLETSDLSWAYQPPKAPKAPKANCLFCTMVPQAYQLSTTQQHKHSNSKTEDIQTTVSLSVRITSYTSRVKSSWAIQL